jgi:hypothetical protein
MAGAGYKLFNTGDVLLASEVNTYLMQQTVMSFADSAARTTALSGVLSEGMVSYLRDTNVVEIYNGSAWASLDDPNAIQNTIVDAKGDIVAASANDTPARLAVGTDNQRLIAASGEVTGLKYVSDTQNTVVDAEGDLLVGDAADALQRLAIGTNNQVLTVDTAVDGKIKWASPASGGGMTLLSTTSLSGASTTISSISQDYTCLKVVVYAQTSSSNYVMRIKPNNASALVNASYDAGNDYTNASGQDFILLYNALNQSTSNNTDSVFVLDIEFYSQTSYKKAWLWKGQTRNNTSGTLRGCEGYGGINTNDAISSLVLSPDNGTFQSGTCLVYGVK